MENYDEYLSHLSDDQLEEEVKKLIRLSKAIPLYKEDRSFRLKTIQLENCLNNFSDAVAKEISIKLMCEIELDAKFKEADAAYDAMRRTLMQSIKDNPKNEQAKEIARKMIQIEKDHGLHDPNNWNEIQNIL